MGAAGHSVPEIPWMPDICLTFFYREFLYQAYVGTWMDHFAPAPQNCKYCMYEIEVVLYSTRVCKGEVKPFRQFTKRLRLRWSKW